MKIKKLRRLRPVALAALGVFLGRGAQADTVLDSTPSYGATNVRINHPYGDYVSASGDGATVTGFGTPNIGLAWTASADAGWDYYDSAGIWPGVAQLDNSLIGATHTLTFTPNSASASVVVKSFNFYPYYTDSIQSYAYHWSVVSGATVLASGNTNFLASNVKIPVSINYTGAPGQTLKLKLLRTGGAENPAIYTSEYSIAVDDIQFAQLPESVLPVGPQVVSVTPADDQTGVPAVYYPYLASITNGATTLVAGSIQLKLDGSLVSPAPTVSSDGSLTNVSYPGAATLLSSGSHVYTLTYADNLGAIYTNETVFNSVYTTLPSSYALPPSAGVVGGFTYRSVSASTEATDSTNTLAGTVARAKAQLNGTLINPSTTLPYTNSAVPGPNTDGSYNIDTVLNFNDNGVSADPFPGLFVAPPYDWFSTEALMYLQLPAGYYRLGVNSDDGFEVSATPPQGVSGSPIVLGLFDAGRGAADTLFDVQVPTSGIYPFRVVYFENTGTASCSFFSVTNLTTGEKVLINEADPNAIKSFRVLKPQVTSIVRSGANAVVNWAYGTPPFQVQVKTNLTDASWSNVGAPTAGNTANVPIDSNTKFIRVGYSQP